jgi:hypothetical protein
MSNRKPATEPTPAPKPPTQDALTVARSNLKTASDAVMNVDSSRRAAFALEVAKAATNLASVELAVASARLEHREAAAAKREKALEEAKS